MEKSETIRKRGNLTLKNSTFFIEKGELKRYLGEGGEVVIPDGVSSISTGAFFTSSYYDEDYCVSYDGHADKVTSITIPDSVDSFGEDAFINCNNLKSVYYNGSVAGWCNLRFDNLSANPITRSGKLFIENKLVTDLEIPDGVTGIGDYAFAGCVNLTSVTIPGSVKNFGRGAFEGCSNVKSVNYEGDIASWCNLLFADWSANPLYPSNLSRLLYIDNKPITDLEIPDGVTSIGDMAFSGYKMLRSVKLPDSLISIGVGAFSDCYKLTSITIPAGLINLGAYAFSSCLGLTGLTISSGITSIGDYTFKDCNGLTSLTIPDSVTSIGEGAFINCNNLTSVTMPKAFAGSRKSIFGAKLTGLFSKCKFKYT